MFGMRGRELKAIQDNLGLSAEQVSAEASVSMSTLRSIYLDVPTVRPRTKKRVVDALRRLEAREKTSA